MELVSDRLADNHDVDEFDCGVPELDGWLRTSARNSDGRAITRTYVWHRGDDLVVGYYTLMPYMIERGTLSDRQGRGLPDTIPCYLLARLTLHHRFRGRGLGAVLLAEALVRAADAADAVGGRFVVVDAIDSSAAEFYAHMGFAPLLDSADRMVMRVKDVQALRASVGGSTSVRPTSGRGRLGPG